MAWRACRRVPADHAAERAPAKQTLRAACCRGRTAARRLWHAPAVPVRWHPEPAESVGAARAVHQQRAVVHVAGNRRRGAATPAVMRSGALVRLTRCWHADCSPRALRHGCLAPGGCSCAPSGDASQCVTSKRVERSALHAAGCAAGGAPEQPHRPGQPGETGRGRGRRRRAGALQRGGRDTFTRRACARRRLGRVWRGGRGRARCASLDVQAEGVSG